jgi:hypothetical protein
MMVAMIRTRRKKLAVVVASACAACAPRIGSPPEYEPGSHMGVIHASHVPDLEADGWIVTRYPHEPPDVVCVHYHEAHWQDG